MPVGLKGFQSTHGEGGAASRTRLYRIWGAMKGRCARDAYAKWYRDKGVVVCAEWLDFMGFRAWALANGYAAHLTIDRIDSAGNYEPANCQWVTPGENSRKAGINRAFNMSRGYFGGMLCEMG